MMNLFVYRLTLLAAKLRATFNAHPLWAPMLNAKKALSLIGLTALTFGLPHIPSAPSTTAHYRQTIHVIAIGLYVLLVTWGALRVIHDLRRYHQAKELITDHAAAVYEMLEDPRVQLDGIQQTVYGHTFDAMPRQDQIRVALALLERHVQRHDKRWWTRTGRANRYRLFDSDSKAGRFVQLMAAFVPLKLARLFYRD